MVSRPILKILTILVSFTLFTFIVGVVWLVVISRSLPDVRFLSDPGVSFQITVRDWQGNEKPFTVGPENSSWTPLATISPYFKKAVLAGEDFSFYSHNGVDWFEVKESFFRNLETHRFARGASSITQQLAKNLFLTREKTLTRKIRELILTHRMEKALAKDRILELYLNIVELGDMIYGANQGSRYHFGKDPAFLSLRESTILAAMLPGPKVYNPDRYLDKVMNRSDHLLGVMLKGRMISNEEYIVALGEMPFASGSPSPDGLPQVPLMEEEAGPSLQGTVLTVMPDLPEEEQHPLNEEPEPVQVPIPGY